MKIFYAIQATGNGHISRAMQLYPYLQKFVNRFTEANQGKAFYTGLKGLGEMIFEDYETNRKKKIK